MVRLRYLALARLTHLKIALLKSQGKAKISFALLKKSIILLKYSFFAPLCCFLSLQKGNFALFVSLREKRSFSWQSSKFYRLPQFAFEILQ